MKLEAKSVPATILHSIIVKNFKAILTTNYDNAFEFAYEVEKKDFKTQVFPVFNPFELYENNTIVYLHGNSKEKLYIIREEDYSQYYPTVSKTDIEKSYELESFLKNTISFLNLIFISFSFEDEYFEASFNCYISYTTQVYGAIYQLLKDNGVYEHALEYNFEENSRYINRGLVTQIVLGYRNTGDKIDDEKTLMYKLINNGNPKQLIELVRYVPELFQSGDDDINFVKELWGAILSTCSKIDEVIIGLWKWIKLFERPQEMEAELIQSIERFDENEAYRFIEYLEGLVSIDIEFAFRLFKKMVEVVGPVESFRREMVKEIIEAFYKSDKIDKDEVNKIFNRYAKEGFVELVRDLYDKYNPQ